ncbi:MAG: retention module-containing protein, partial [Rhodocyclaceae bacterium]|nr:retention module-containing protein [Rhodocyclaceae bacterium]
MATTQPIATVVAVTGEAFARNASGELRVLKAGDVLHEGEVVITRNGGHVELATSDGQLLEVQPNETVAMSVELSDTTRPTPEDAALGEATVERVIQALEGDGAIDDAIEAPAAGVAGGEGGEGNSFVRLLRIFEDVVPLAFEFGAAVVEPDLTFDGGRDEEGLQAAADVPPGPGVSIPDTDGALNLTDSTLAESAGPVPGSFTISAPAGLGSISVGGTVITPVELDNLAATPITINTGRGILVLTGYDPSTGVVSYTYDPDVQDHSAGDVTDSVAVEVIDTLGRSSSDSIDIAITDSVPLAQNDAAAITEDAVPNTVSGNVLANDT